MFGVFSAASKVLTGESTDPLAGWTKAGKTKAKQLTPSIAFHPERVATYAFELVTTINRNHFTFVVRYGAFADMTVCMVEFCKVSKFQKISLQAIEMLQGVVPTMLACPECGLSDGPAETLPEGVAPPVDDPMIKFWFPVLFSYYDVLMTGEDLEVRRV